MYDYLYVFIPMKMFLFGVNTCVFIPMKKFYGTFLWSKVVENRYREWMIIYMYLF